MAEQLSQGGQNFRVGSKCASGDCIGVDTNTGGNVSVSKVTDGLPVGPAREHTPLAWKVKSTLVALGAPTSLVTPKDVAFDRGERQVLRAGLRGGEFRLPQRKPVQAKIA
jgi:hypothetical protein